MTRPGDREPHQPARGRRIASRNPSDVPSRTPGHARCTRLHVMKSRLGLANTAFSFWLATVTFASLASATPPAATTVHPALHTDAHAPAVTRPTPVAPKTLSVPGERIKGAPSAAIPVVARDWVKAPAIVEHTAPGEILAVSDLHGHYEQAFKLFAGNGVMRGTPNDPGHVRVDRWQRHARRRRRPDQQGARARSTSSTCFASSRRKLRSSVARSSSRSGITKRISSATRSRRGRFATAPATDGPGSATRSSSTATRRSRSRPARTRPVAGNGSAASPSRRR